MQKSSAHFHTRALVLVLLTAIAACISSASTVALYVEYLRRPEEARIEFLDALFVSITWVATRDQIAGSMMSILVSHFDATDADRHIRGGGVMCGVAVGLITGIYLMLRRCVSAVQTRMRTSELAVIAKALPVLVVLLNLLLIATEAMFWPRLLGPWLDPASIWLAIRYALIFLAGSLVIFGAFGTVAYWSLLFGFRFHTVGKEP